MERELTINNSVCGRWFLSLIALLLMSVGMQAEDYGLTVGGVPVTDENASNITGTSITAGSVSYSNGTLTLNGATIQGPIISSNNSSLTVHLVGRNTITTSQGVVPFQSSVSSASLTFTAASGGMLLTNTPRTEGDVIIWSGFNFSSENNIPSGYALSWDANEYCNLGEYYKLFLKSLEFQYLAAQYVTAANCDNLLKDQKTGRTMVYYDATENVLTLDNANVDCSANESGDDYYLINKVYGNENLKVNLVGNNYLDADVEVGLAWGDNLTFTTNTTDPGMLTVSRGETTTPFIDGTGTSYINGLGYSYIEELNKHVIQTSSSSSYNLWIDGEQVTSENKDAICSGQVSAGVITFDGDHTLTLNNVPWICFDSQYPFIKTSMDLTVHLVGTSQPDMGNVFIQRVDGDNETHTLTFTTDPTNPGQFLVRGGSLSHEGFTVVYENDLAENPEGYYEEGDGDAPYAWIAQQSLGLKVAGTVVTSGNAANVLGGETSTVSFDATRNTLTLNNATISGSIEKTANEEGDQLIINLVGTNTVNGQILFQSPDLTYPGDLTFTGNGSLNISSDDGVFYGVSSVNTAEGLYIATDSPDPQCRNGYYFASNSDDTTIKNVTVSTSVTYPVWVYNTSTTHYTQLTAAAPSYTTAEQNVDENHSGSVSFSGNTLTLTNFLCKTTENSEFVFFIGKSLQDLTVNLVGESSIYYSGFHYAEIEEDEDEPTLTYTTSSNGRLTYTGEPSYWSYDVTVNYENGLGYYSNVISTDWPRLQIGNTYVRGTTSTVEGYSNVSYDDETNTLTLGGVTIGTQGATVTDITVYIKDLNVEISGTNTVYGRFYGSYEEDYSIAGTITFKKKSGAGTAKLTVSGYGEGGPVTNFVSSTVEESLSISGINTDNEPVSSLSYQDGDYYDLDNPDKIIKEVLITSNVLPFPLWISGIQVTSDNSANVLGDDLSEEGSVATVSYDTETNTLTLNGASIDAFNNEAVVSGLDNLTIFLVGENSISGANGFTFNKTATVEEATVTFTTDEESNGSLYINNLEEYLFGEGVTPVYSNVYMKHDGDYHTIDCQLGISVGGVEVTSFNKDDVLDDGKVSYDPETNTLTLNNATIEPEEETSGIAYSNAGDLKIALIGNNSIQGGEGCTAISCYGGVETPNLRFAKGDAAQHFSLTLIAQSGDDLIDGFNVNYGGFFVFDEVDDGIYTSTISTTAFGGTGSADEPFLIKTADDLKKFANYYNDGVFSNNVHIQLFTDIDCEDEEGFTTIANHTDATFYGVFDGNQKTISNLTMTGLGLFGYVSKDDEFGVGTIKDLTLSNFTLTGNDYATGGIVATLSDGAVVSNCTVENSTIACAGNQYNPEVGGVVGRLYSSTVTGCTVNNVQMKAETSYTGGSGAASSAGGIVGNASSGSIETCVVMNGSKITNYYADEYATLNVGAIVGNQSETTLSENYYYYNVTVEKLNGTDVANKIVKSGYEQRGVGGESYNEQTEEMEANPDVFEDNGAVMYTKKVTLPAESDEASVMGEEGTYYSTVVESDVLSILVAPGQTVTVNVMPSEGYAIASLIATNTTTEATISTSSEYLGDNETQYTFTMPDAPVNVSLTTAAAYGITVAGVAVTELNYSDVLGDHKVSFDVETSTLTLNGATINGNVYYSLEDELTVHLLGQNVIDGGWSEDADGLYAFVCESENASLAFTTDDENPGQLLMKNTYRNKWGYGQYYTDGFSWNKTYGNGLVEGYSNDEKHLIAVGPTITPGEGLYWTDQEYTITAGAQISCSNSQGQAVEVSVSDNSFTLTETGKYNIGISKTVTLDDSNFSMYAEGLYFVHNKPGFSVAAGTYNDTQVITLTNLPTLSENSYPQVWYYFDDDEENAVQYTSVEQEIELTESAKVCVYFLDQDSGKVLKSAPVEAEYTIKAKTELNISYAQNSRNWASYYNDENSLETPEGLQAYVVTEATKNGVVVETIDYIPQNVPVLLKRTANITEPIVAKAYLGTEVAPAVNKLKGTANGVDVASESGSVYALYNDGFTRATKGTIGANRAYLVFDDTVNAGVRLGIFEDEATAVENVNRETITNEQYYDLQGRKVQKPVNGLYIVNGQKRIVK